MLYFSIVIVLYQLPISAVFYPLLLCTVAGLGIMGCDMFQNYQRYTALWQMLDAVGLDLNQDFLSEKKNDGKFQTADGAECDWELLQEMLYGQKKTMRGEEAGRLIFTGRW